MEKNNFTSFHVEGSQSMLQQLIEEYKKSIDNFYVLFLFDQQDSPYNYTALFKQYITQGTIINLNNGDIFSLSKRFVLTEEAYYENEELFYKLRLHSRDWIVEKLAKTVIFYVLAQNVENHAMLLNDQNLLDDTLKKTKSIMKKLTFIGDSITWEVFYNWCRQQFIALVLEEIIFTYGVNGVKALSTEQLNELFFKILSTNLADNKQFIQKISQSIELYMQEWSQKIIDELNNDIQTYLRIEHVVGEIQEKKVEKDSSKLKVIPNYIFVMNNVAYQAVREAIYRKNFTQHTPDSWPISYFIKGNTRGHIQIIPKSEEDELFKVAADNVQSLCNIDVDVFDIMCSIFLNRAKHPDDIIKIDLADILAMRGLKLKLGGHGRRGGYEAKQKEQVINALKNIQSIWLTIDKTVLYKNNKPVQVSVQGRTFVFKNLDGKEYVVNKETCSKSIFFTVDKVFAKYLTASQRQVALLPIKSIQYHGYRFNYEKQLCRYLSWRWRTQAYKGNFLQKNRVSTLLEATGETLNERSPLRTRDRFEKALDQLAQDGLIAAWHYVNWNEEITTNKGWAKYWLNTSVVIEPPNLVKEHYRSIDKNKKQITEQKSTKKEVEDQRLGDKVLKCRKERNLTLLQLAEELQVSAPYISNIERNQVKPSAQLKTKILKWLNQPF
ncbi:MAG: helix-turn-helix domain-containing protein [Lysinibacillus sp.]